VRAHRHPDTVDDDAHPAAGNTSKFALHQSPPTGPTGDHPNGAATPWARQQIDQRFEHTAIMLAAPPGDEATRGDAAPLRRRLMKPRLAPGEVLAYDMGVLNAVEARIVGCLIEKEATTPDLYPLTLNSLTTACNQSTNRDPVTRLDPHDIEAALGDLKLRGFIRVVHSPSNRATKYRHIADETLRLDDAEQALIGVLLLRGAQTPGELRLRTERHHRFDSVPDLEAVLDALSARPEPLTRRLERSPGQKEHRWIELISDQAWIGAESSAAHVATGTGTAAPGSASVGSPSLSERVAALEARLTVVEAELELYRPDPGPEI
jgi:uncharacterized protein